MPSPRYPEHDAIKIPDTVALCPRCKRGLVQTFEVPLVPRHYCYTCGNDEPGIPYTRDVLPVKEHIPTGSIGSLRGIYEAAARFKRVMWGYR